MGILPLASKTDKNLDREWLMLLIVSLTLGLILGPTGFNLEVPQAASSLFFTSGIGFLFCAGLELSLKDTLSCLHRAGWLSIGAVGVPFFTGLACSVFLTSTSDPLTAKNLFIALAFSVSALPVIIQVLKDVRLFGTPIGTLIVSTASICDIIVWILFSLVLSYSLREAWLRSHIAVFFFFAGLGLSAFPPFKRVFLWPLQAANTVLFAPVFFAGVGLKIDLQHDFHIGKTIALILLACFGKITGSYIFSRLIHLSRAESWIVAIGLNARGAMEILLCSLGLEAGIIDRSLFTSLVAMAIATSIGAVPLMRIILIRTKYEVKANTMGLRNFVRRLARPLLDV